jgi:hypothetical protein
MSGMGVGAESWHWPSQVQTIATGEGKKCVENLRSPGAKRIRDQHGQAV